MTTQPNHSEELSDCHQAPVKLVGGRGDFSNHDAGITMHYECTECGEACDIANYSDDEVNIEVIAYPAGSRFIGPGDDVVISAEKLQAYVQQEAEKAYEQGRIAEAKACEQARRHDVKKEVLKGQIEELNRIHKEVVNNNVAGPVKWEIEDRLTSLKAKEATHE